MGVFIQAHQDDWQLCMASKAYDDLIEQKDKTLFIYLTAGDASNPDDRHWKAREMGARASVNNISSAISKHKCTETYEQREYNGHYLDYFTIGSASSVFLRIPDMVNGPSLLQQLKDGNPVTTLGPVMNIFLNWEDLLATITEIVKRDGVDESGVVWFNAISDCKSSGHRDHKLTAQAVASVASIIASSHLDKMVNVAWFQGTARKILATDDNIHKRVAALLPYENEMLKIFPDGSHCTLSEPLIVLRKLLAAEICSHQIISLTRNRRWNWLFLRIRRKGLR